MVFLFFLSHLFAAPAPGTGLSRPLDALSADFWSLQGFRLNFDSQKWFAESSAPPDLLLRLRRSSQSNDDLMTLRHSEKYDPDFIKDYPVYGLTVLRSEKISLHPPVHVIDVVGKDQRRVRQYIWVNARRVVQLSCTGKPETFSSLVDECNRVAKDFSWTSASSNQKVSESNL